MLRHDPYSPAWTSVDGYSALHIRRRYDVKNYWCSDANPDRPNQRSVTLCRSFLSLLRLLLFGAIGTLLMMGAAIAHDSHRPAYDHRVGPIESQQIANTASVVPSLSCSHSPAETVVIFSFDQSQASLTGTILYSDSSTDPDSSDGCCATACHAAVTNFGLGLFTPSYLKRIDPPARSSVLHGQSQGPGDRPPQFT